MEIDMNAMKAELGGAFVLSWAVFAMDLGTLKPSNSSSVVMVPGAEGDQILGRGSLFCIRN